MWTLRELMTPLIFSAVSLEKLKQCLSLRYVYAVLYYGISIVLLFSGVSKIIDSTPMVETIKAVFKVDEAQKSVEEFIEFYNNHYPHSTLGYISPVDFSQRDGSPEKQSTYSKVA